MKIIRIKCDKITHEIVRMAEQLSKQQHMNVRVTTDTDTVLEVYYEEVQELCDEEKETCEHQEEQEQTKP